LTNSAFSIDMKQVGALAADLLCGDPTWIRRRKLRVDFVDDIVARIRQSVDFCIPSEVLDTSLAAGPGTPGTIVHLPLFVLRKAPQELTDFDLVDADRAALSLPTRETNAELSKHALLARAEKVLGIAVEASSIATRVEEIALEPPGAGLDACDRLIGREPPSSSAAASSEAADVLAQDAGFRFLARLLASASIVAMPVEIKPGQQLLKLSYSEPIMQWNEDWEPAMRVGLSPLPAQVDLPFLGAQTFHLEVHPPDGMSVSSGLLAVATRRGPELLEVPTTSRSIHLYMPDGDKAQSGAALVGLRAQRGGFMETARAACAAVTTILALCIIFAGPLAEANKTMPTLLLFFPGLLATFALQPMRHALTQRVLSTIRNLTLICAAAAFLAAFVLIAAPVERGYETARAGSSDLTLEGGPKSAPAKAAKGASGAAPSLLSIGADAKLTVIEQAPRSEGASVLFLRIVWGLLLLVSLSATALVAVATRKAMP
jgi:hypothetical protein